MYIVGIKSSQKTSPSENSWAKLLFVAGKSNNSEKLLVTAVHCITDELAEDFSDDDVSRDDCIPPIYKVFFNISILFIIKS